MQEKDSKSMSDIRRKSGELLSQNGNRLLLTEALLFSLSTVPAYLFFSYAFSVLWEVSAPAGIALIAMVASYVLLMIAFTVFVTGPLLFGLFYMAYRMVKGDRVVLGDLFYAFSASHNYRQALQVAAALVLRVCLCAAVVICTYLFFLLVFPNQLIMMLLCGILITAEVIGGALFCYSMHPLTFCILEGCPFRESAVQRAERGFRFAAGFVLWILLGLLTVGVLLLWDTLPRMLIAYFYDMEA